LGAIAEALLEKETLSDEQIDQLVSRN